MHVGAGRQHLGKAGRPEGDLRFYNCLRLYLQAPSVGGVPCAVPHPTCGCSWEYGCATPSALPSLSAGLPPCRLCCAVLVPRAAPQAEGHAARCIPASDEHGRHVPATARPLIGLRLQAARHAAHRGRAHHAHRKARRVRLRHAGGATLHGCMACMHRCMPTQRTHGTLHAWREGMPKRMPTHAWMHSLRPLPFLPSLAFHTCPHVSQKLGA